MGEKWDRKKKLKFLVAVSASISLLAITVLLVIWSILLTDKTKNTYVRSDSESSEIIMKNYIKGFENISETGEFSFRFREDEINDLLLDGVKAINDKHIESINYEKDENNFHIFYVDLKKMPIKTRVVISTYVSDWTETSIDLKIYTAKIGKVEAAKYLTRKGYLTENFLNKYFEACHLPISYNESSKTLKIEAANYIEMFPKGEFATFLWNEVLETPNCCSINPTSFGVNVSFSKLRTSTELTKKTFDTPFPNFYNELKEALEAIDFSTMSPGDTTTAYEVSLDEFDHLLMNNLPNEKEIVSTPNLSSNASFEVVATSTIIQNDDSLDVAYLYALNGYLVDIHQQMVFNDYSETFYEATFEIKNPITFNKKDYTPSDDEYLKYFNPLLVKIFKNIGENQGNFIFYSENNNTLNIDLEGMNDSHTSSSLQNSWKSVVIDSTSKSIHFNVTKTV